MLDKSIEYKNVIMRIESDKFNALADISLPGGFSFKFFQPQDVKHWGSIETSVLEFASEAEACKYFELAYLPKIDDLQKRCVFVLNPAGVPVATANAWYSESELGYQASLHWVAVRPEYQRKGLGKAITQKALTVFNRLEPGKPVWLHTQTWSHAAIKLYHSVGFNMVKHERLATSHTRTGIAKIYQNDFEEAIQILRNIMDEDYVNWLVKSAV